MKINEKQAHDVGREADGAADLGREEIPDQYTGQKLDAVAKLELSTKAEALRFFESVKKRFFCVNQWAEIAKLPMSTFQLTDAEGDEVNRKAREGDYIKINIPGPGTTAGEGYDWVLIEKLVDQQGLGTELISMRARPAHNPRKDGEAIAHFLDESATSTFQIKRMGSTIYAEEHARNEQSNHDSERTLDNLRNRIIGWAATIGFSYPQWKGLVEGWLRRD